MSISFRQTNCSIEYSEDNGITWAVAADLSQCLNAQIAGQPGDALRCSIATHLATVLKDMQDAVIGGMHQNVDTLTLGGLVIGVVGALVVGPAVAVLVAAVTAVAGKIGDEGVDTYSNALTAAFYDYAKCQLYCLLPDDGSLSAATIDAWASSLRSYTGSYNAVMQTVGDYVAQFPLATWTNLAAVAAAAQVAGDCSQCECLPDNQLIADQTNGTPTPVQDPNNSALWTLSSTSTPNEGNDYVVRYSLPYPKSCLRFETSANGNFAYSSGVPFAGFRSCGQTAGYDREFTLQTTPTIVDLYAVGHDIQPCFNAFYIRMSEPFTLQVSLSDCEEGEWCHLETVGVSSAGWSTTFPSIPGTVTNFKINLSSGALSVLQAGYINSSGEQTYLPSGIYSLDEAEEHPSWDGMSLTGVTGWFWNELGESGQTTPNVVSYEIHGTGANPWGSSNC